MKKFTRLYAEGGDIVNKFFPTGSVGSSSMEMASDGEKKKKRQRQRCSGGKCTTKQPPGLGGRKKIQWKGRGKTQRFN